MIGLILIGAAVALIVRSVGNERGEDREKSREVQKMINYPLANRGNPFQPVVDSYCGQYAMIPPSPEAVLANKEPAMFANLANITNYRNNISAVQISLIDGLTRHSSIAEAVARGGRLNVDVQFYRAGLFGRKRGSRATAWID